MNCWDFKECGRESTGIHALEFGICPAYPNNGDDCARTAGTFCRKAVQGSFARGLKNCRKCDFYNSEHYDTKSRMLDTINDGIFD